MAGISSTAATTLGNKYKYNGKEEQRQEFSDGSGLEWLDYGARMYDALVGRFFTQDRFSEEYYNYNSYHYCLNDPIKNVDINGDYVMAQYTSKDADGNDIEVCLTYKRTDNGSYGFFDDQGNVYVAGSDLTGFIDQVSDALSQLASISNHLQIMERFDQVVESNFQHLIRATPGNGSNGDNTRILDVDGKVIGNVVDWDPTQLTVEGVKVNQQTVLGHELLGHSFLVEMGKASDRRSDTGLPLDEADGVSVENVIRRNSNPRIPDRTHYTTSTDPNGLSRPIPIPVPESSFQHTFKKRRKK
jgi:RHS repeat-associated protein